MREGILPTPRTIVDLSGEDPGTRARSQFRAVSTAQGDIFRTMVLYTPPDKELNLVRLLEEHNGLLLSAAKEFRTWLSQNPRAYIPDPNAVDIADLTCEDP